ncbi:LacI family DNA-binding transcriptional regulator [Thermoflexibacter ruber]|uniref:Transcriptional regulator, LacI family n=1 Tax=Thermoflexibacter ruber TaxID=1003 RepID=A0A1I2BKK3_9BACT|nr:LacI family DNA-binding transcriptional regulator [Thermoflexibacter ruber]SFE56732.1 transcriptional regulator, LacI family [Thermoflexibacter ruber]
MKNEQITIKDIAKALNISTSTVSRALRNHPDISDETKKAVAELAKQMQYHPNSIASSLRNKRTNTIGIIVPEIIHTFFASVIAGVEEVAYAEGYKVLICQSNETYEKEIINMQTLISSRVDGILVSISNQTQKYEHFEWALQRKIPLVFFDRVCEDLNTSKVIVDDYEGSFQATEHLILSGCRRIAHIAGPQNLEICKKRKEGYLDALKAHDMPINEELIVYSHLDQREGMLLAEKLLTLPQKPDAIFAVTDPVAIGAHIAIRKHGLKMPEQISLMGFTNDAVSDIIEPSISTMAQPSFEMGKVATRQLIYQIKNKTAKPERIVLKTELIERNSTKKIRLKALSHS